MKEIPALKWANTTQEAEYYSASVANLRRWKMMGKKAKDLFPSHDPRLVVEWWGRHNQKGAPAGIVQAVARFTGKLRVRHTKPDPSIFNNGGLKAALERCRAMEALHGTKLEEALRKGDAVTAQLYQQSHGKYLKQLREVELAYIEMAKKMKDLIDRGEARAAFIEAIGHLPRAVERCLKQAKPDFLTEEVWGKTVLVVIERAFSLMPTALPEVLDAD